MAISTNGSLWMWGQNSSGELGLKDTITRSSPVQVGTLTDWSKIFPGNTNSFAIKTDGTLWSWGANGNGVLGLGDNNVSRSSPVQVGGTTDWDDISIGNYYAIAKKTDGTLWVWGYDLTGNLGQGIAFSGNRSSPVQIGTLSDWSKVYASRWYYQSGAIKTNGTLWMWGVSSQGQLGLNETGTKNSPVQVGTLSNWSSLSLGYNHSSGIKTDGTLWSWGGNSQGQLGLNNTIDRSSPVQVGTLSNWSKIVATKSNTMALKTDGTIWYWGFWDSLVGDGVVRSSPTQIGVDNNWNDIANSYYFILAKKTNGEIYSAGKNDLLQLGRQTLSSYEPIQLNSDTDWGELSLGNSYSFGLKTNGTLWSWGTQSFGELGLNNAVTTRSSPIQVGTLTSWSKISSGTSHTMAVRTNGTLWAWGNNSSGELALGDTINRSSPVQVGTLTTWSNADAKGISFSIMVDTSNALYSAGAAGTKGALGYHTAFTTNRSSPVQIGGRTKWSKVAVAHVSGFSIVAIQTNKTLWGWGGNSIGQLGIGDKFPRSSPVQISSEGYWENISFGNRHFVAIKKY